MGTEETCRFVRATWKGEEVVWLGERIRVPRGVNSRGFLMMMLGSVSDVGTDRWLEERAHRLWVGVMNFLGVRAEDLEVGVVA